MVDDVERVFSAFNHSEDVHLNLLFLSVRTVDAGSYFLRSFFLDIYWFSHDATSFAFCAVS